LKTGFQSWKKEHMSVKERIKRLEKCLRFSGENTMPAYTKEETEKSLRLLEEVILEQLESEERNNNEDTEDKT